MSSKQGIGDPEYLRKRIPQNPKYQQVKTRLDTGCSVSKYIEKLEDIKKNYRYRKDELFKRLKVSTFAQLVLQVASVSDLNDDRSPFMEGHLSLLSEAQLLSEPTNGSRQATPSPLQLLDIVSEQGDIVYSSRSTLQNVINGVGELDLDRNGQKVVNSSHLSSVQLSENHYSDSPYLLLDVRDRDLYDQCHIIGAYSYPIATLSRTMNPYTKEVLEYKNAEGKIIILYDEDERIASQAATTMCERGFENLFMLSGGLKVIAQKFPEGLTTGPIPASCQMAAISRKRHTPKQTMQVAERKWRFTSDDVAKIQQQMEEVLVPSEPSSRMSSRMLTSSSRSTAFSNRSGQRSIIAGKESNRAQSSRPWK